MPLREYPLWCQDGCVSIRWLYSAFRPWRTMAYAHILFLFPSLVSVVRWKYFSQRTNFLFESALPNCLFIETWCAHKACVLKFYFQRHSSWDKSAGQSKTSPIAVALSFLFIFLPFVCRRELGDLCASFSKLWGNSWRFVLLGGEILQDFVTLRSITCTACWRSSNF